MPLGEYGEGYVVVEMDGNGNVKTERVQIVRRKPDGSEQMGATLAERVEHTFLTLREAVGDAVARVRRGEEVRLERAIDGRSGAHHSRETICEADVLTLIVYEAML